MLLVVTLFQFQSVGIKSISWYDFSIPIFFPIIAIHCLLKEILSQHRIRH